MCWQGDVAVYTKAQWRDIFLKQAMNICLIYNTKVSVEIHLPGPLQSNIEDPGAPLGTARVPRGGCRTQVFPPAQLFPLDILLLQLFWSVLHVPVPLLRCSSKALGIWACPVPQLSARSQSRALVLISDLLKCPSDLQVLSPIVQRRKDCSMNI